MLKSLLKNANSKGFFHLLTANYFIGFLGLASQLLVVKFLTPVEMGQIKVLQSYIAVISVLAGFGFNTAVLKICSEKINIDIKRKILLKNIFYTLISIAFVVMTVFVIAKFQFLSDDKDINQWMTIYLLFVPASVLTGLFISYLQALKQIKLMATVQSLIRLFGVFLIVIFTYLYGFVGFVWATIIVSYIGLLGIMWFMREEISFDWSYSLGKRNFSYARWSVAANFIGTSAMYMDIFILNSIADNREQLGYYSIATIFLLGMNYITSTIQSVATPYFSEKSNDKNEFIRVLSKYLKLTIITSIIIGVLALFIIPIIIEFIYGQQYKLVGDFFQILVFKYIFWSSFALMGVAILGIGGMKFNFMTSLFTTIVAFFITYNLGLQYGIYGVAYGQVISYFIAMIFILAIGRKVINNHFKKMEATND